MTNRLQGNLWKYTLLLITNKRVFVAILGTYYLTIPGVTPQWIGIILLAGSLTGFVLEIPSGYLADKIGHKEALIISRLLMLLSSVLFLVSSNVLLLILASICFSASHAFHTGTGSAFMHETLRALGREEEYSRVMGKMSSIGFALPIVLSALVPFLVEIDYKLPFLIGCILDIVGLWAALMLMKPPITAERIEEIGLANFRDVIHEGLRLRYFRYAIFSGIIAGILLTVGVFRAPYQAFLDLPVVWFGVFFGAGRVLASIILAYSGKLHTYFQNIQAFYRFKFLLYAALLLPLGLTSEPAIIVFLFLIINAFQWGLSQVGAGFLLTVVNQSSFKATLLSVPAQVETTVTAFSAVLLGSLIEHFSYQTGFLTFALIFIVILLPLYFFSIRVPHHPQTPAPTH